MPKTFKFQTDGIVYGNEIPDDIEDLELDCKAVAAKAFERRTKLRTVKLVGTEAIGTGAFSDCKNLMRAELPETLRSLGSRVFEKTSLRELVIPRSVSELGMSVVTNYAGDTYSSVMEIFSEEGAAPAFFNGCRHLADNTLLIVRSAASGEILFRFMVIDCLEDVLTWSGPDFTSYDQRLLDGIDRQNPNDRAIRVRVEYPADISCETLGKFREHISDKAVEIIKKLTENSFFGLSFLNDYLYDDLTLKAALELILYSQNKGEFKATEKLKEFLYQKITGDLSYMSSQDLKRCAEISSEQGLTEVTAAVMQEFHRRQTQD